MLRHLGKNCTLPMHKSTLFRAFFIVQKHTNILTGQNFLPVRINNVVRNTILKSTHSERVYR